MTDIRRWLTEDEVEALRVARAATSDIAANDPSRVIASLEGTARLREVLHATRDHWIAHHDAVLGVYALSNEWRGDDLRVAGLEGVRDYLLDHAPCGNGPLERALRALLEGFPRDLEPKP